MSQELASPAQTNQRPPLSAEELMAHIQNASPEIQTAIAQKLAFMQGASNQEVAAQVTQALGPQVPLNVEQVKIVNLRLEQQQAVETTVELTAKANTLAAKGLDEDHISAELKQAGASTAVAQNFAQTGVQQHQQGQQDEKLAAQRAEDDTHRVKVGLAEPEPAKAAHPFAALLDKDLVASIGAAMGGAQQAQHHAQTAEVGMAAGGKSAPDVAVRGA